jgi:hypothetical protein
VYSERDENGDVKDPPLPIRARHQKACQSYAKWRLSRWNMFNQSLVGACVAIFLRQHKMEYFGMGCDETLIQRIRRTFFAEEEPTLQ